MRRRVAAATMGLCALALCGIAVKNAERPEVRTRAAGMLAPVAATLGLRAPLPDADAVIAKVEQEDEPVAVLYPAPTDAPRTAAAVTGEAPLGKTDTGKTETATAEPVKAALVAPAPAREAEEELEGAEDVEAAPPAPPAKDEAKPSQKVTPSATPFSEEEGAALARAQSYAKKGQHLFALNVYRKLGQNHDTDARVLRGWSEAAVKTKGWGEALRVAIRWASTDSAPDAQLYLARIQRAAGQRYGAVATLTRLIEARPDVAEAKEMLDKMGDRKLASR